MANIKISEMTEATSFDDGDYTMIVQANQNKKISKENMLSDIPTIQNNISTINTNIGDLTNLQTPSTDNLVNAINSNLPVILYSNEENPVSTGTITLNDNIENYKKIDITFLNSDNETAGITIYNPSNKKICLKSTHAGSTQYYYVDYFSYITLIGTTGTFSDGRTLVISSNKTIFNIVSNSTQRITSIIGYK